MKKIYFLFLLLLPFIALSQHKYDYQWTFGYGDDFDNYFGINLLDFNDLTVEIFPFQEIDGFDLGNAGSLICNKDGEIILMTDNCEVVDKDFLTIEGGDEITPGEIHNSYCHIVDYPADQSTLFLPEMSNDSTIYLLHKDIELDDNLQDVPSRNLYLSTIVRRLDGSFYVKEKQHLLLNEDMILGRLTAVLNADMDKWWVWTLEYDSNRFYKFLIGGQDTVQGPFIQEIGPILDNHDLDIGQTSFSPNAQMLAINSETYGVILYNFEAQSGMLFNYRTLSYPNMDTANGLSFSSNSQFIYTTTADDLYQIELHENQLDYTVTHLGTYRSPDITGWPIGLGKMHLGPDCRIYVSPGTSSLGLHVIHQPNFAGLDCQFEERAITPFGRLNFDLPNLPMYRFNGSCDSTISWGIISGEEEIVPIEEKIRLYPNPASDYAILSLPAHHSFMQAAIWNMQGQEMMSINIPSGQQQISIALDKLAYGVYFIKLQGDDTYTLKLLKN